MHEFKHIDPEDCGAEKLYATVAVTGEVAHKLMNWTACHSRDLDHVDEKDWELFSVSHRGTHQGREYIWGMFLEGIGAFNVMVPIQNVRNITKTERAARTERPMQMVGSHTGKVSYGFSASIGPDLPTRDSESKKANSE